MTEQEWNASADPERMLTALQRWNAGTGEAEVRSHPIWYSARKLRLFACAVARTNGHDLVSIAHVEECVEVGQPNHNFSDQDAIDRGQFWRLCRSEDAARGAAHAYCGVRTANLLREIVSNPWRAMAALWAERTYYPADDTSPVTERYPASPWLTPQVLDLAHAAYQERPGRVCGRCKGRWRTVDGYSTCEVQEGDDPPRWRRCPDCGGTGRIEDDTLDPQRLAVLADALEESGCQDEALLRHLRGQMRNPICDGLGRTLGEDCWVPKAAPCVRGCWVLDCILGRQ